MVESMKGHGWMESDILDLMGVEKLKPNFYPMSSFWRISRLYMMWLIYRADGGMPKEQDLISDIDCLTQGHKARRREERAWQAETIKVMGVDSWLSVWGPTAGFPMLRVQTASCNQRCPTCPHPATWEGGTVMSVKGLEMAIKKVRGNEMILHLEGGEPLLWQRGPAFTDLLYRWCSAKRQAHLKSNGTIRPRKIFRDVFGLITLEPDLEVNPDMDFWKGQIEWYEQNAAPLWAPIVTEKTVDKVEKLFYPLDYERVLPQARQPKDYNLLVKTCVNMGWKVDIYREKGAPVEVKPNAS